MEDFKGKEIECQKCTYVQDGALQENTVQTNFKKPRSCYKMALGSGSNNQNGNLRWFLPLGVDPPPRNGHNF